MFKKESSNEPQNDNAPKTRLTEVESLKNQLAETAEKALDAEDKYKRALADFVNFKNQNDAQLDHAKKLAKDSTILKIIPLIDDIKRAIKANPETLKPVEKTLEKAMKDLSLEEIDASENVDFNPDLHEAISMEDGEGEKEVIAEELRPGYKYEGKVLRPAMVRVKHA